jgi:hypothetical protein
MVVIYAPILVNNDQTSCPGDRIPHGEHVELATAWPGRHKDHHVVVKEQSEGRTRALHMSALVAVACVTKEWACKWQFEATVRVGTIVKHAEVLQKGKDGLPMGSRSLFPGGRHSGG